MVDLHAAVREGNISKLEESLHGASNCDILDEDLVGKLTVSYSYSDDRCSM